MQAAYKAEGMFQLDEELQNLMFAIYSPVLGDRLQPCINYCYCRLILSIQTFCRQIYCSHFIYLCNLSVAQPKLSDVTDVSAGFLLFL